MYCKNCGTEIKDGSKFCVNCGKDVNDCGGTVQSVQTQSIQAPILDYSGSFLLWLVGFFIPVAGLILFLCMRKDEPGKARSAGKGALTAFVIHIVLVVLYIVAVFFIGYFGVKEASSQIYDSAYNYDSQEYYDYENDGYAYDYNYDYDSPVEYS